MSLLTVKLFVNVITLTVQTELDTSNTRSLRGDRGAGEGRARRGRVAACPWARRSAARQSSVARQKQRARVSACTRGSWRSRWTTRVARRGGPRGGRAARGACAARPRRRSTSSTATGSSRARPPPPPPPPPRLHSPTGLTVVELE